MLGNSLQHHQMQGQQQIPGNYSMNMHQFHPQKNNGMFSNFVMNQISNNMNYNPYQQFPPQQMHQNPMYGYNYPPPPPPGNSGW